MLTLVARFSPTLPVSLAALDGMPVPHEIGARRNPENYARYRKRINIEPGGWCKDYIRYQGAPRIERGARAGFDAVGTALRARSG